MSTWQTAPFSPSFSSSSFPRKTRPALYNGKPKATRREAGDSQLPDLPLSGSRFVLGRAAMAAAMVLLRNVE